jgi:hypothetical protein
VTDFLDSDRLLAFFGASGFKTHKSASGWWYEAGPRFLLGVPTHAPIHLERSEAAEICKQTGALGVRYITSDAGVGSESWQMVATGSDYSLENFSANTRSKIRRGLKKNEIRRISGQELKTAGEQAFLDTVSRQGRADRYGLERWHRLLDAADAEPAIEIWSAWHEDKMAAYLLIMPFEDSCEFYEARSRNDTLKAYPNNALLYTVTEDILVKRGISEITFGIEGLEDLDSLDAFKLAMGYYRKPVRQHVMFRPALTAALAIPPVRSAIGMLARRDEGASFWRRAEGLMGFAGFERR